MVVNDQQRRFILDDRSYIIDKANLADIRKYKYHGEPNDSDKDIRRYLLRRRLNRLVLKLIVGPEARTVRQSLVNMLLAVIEASQLNKLDPSLSIDHPFKGKLRRKEEMRDYTSISLFIGDVERVLRELYGDLDGDALEELLFAIRVMVVEFTKYVRPDLHREYYDADACDYLVGFDRAEGYGLTDEDHQKARIAADALAIRAMQVSAKPDAYCRYTCKFVEALDEEWPHLGGWERRRRGLNSNVHAFAQLYLSPISAMP
jgi:hypothetical protein